MIKKSRIVKLSDDMHHCSSICHDSKGHYLTFYYGKECTDDQRVALLYYPNHGDDYFGNKHYYVLEQKTGNPIVFNYKGEIFLIYSKFTDCEEDGTPIDYGRNIVQRWKNCDNFVARVVVDDKNIILKDINKIDKCYGRLARCQPVEFNGEMLIPMYREADPISEVWSFDGKNVILKSQFGFIDDDVEDVISKNNLQYNYLGSGVAIQPTLIEEKGNLLAFCRNVCRSNNQQNRNAWFSKSVDGLNWSRIEYTGIPNHNNSLVAIPFSGRICFVLNVNASRDNMILYDSKSRKSVHLNVSLLRSRNSFSYPNYDWNGNILNIVHTNCGRIMWHQIDEEFLYEAFGE